jgi:hypothetical protein
MTRGMMMMRRASGCAWSGRAWRRGCRAWASVAAELWRSFLKNRPAAPARLRSRGRATAGGRQLGRDGGAFTVTTFHGASAPGKAKAPRQVAGHAEPAGSVNFPVADRPRGGGGRKEEGQKRSPEEACTKKDKQTHAHRNRTQSPSNQMADNRQAKTETPTKQAKGATGGGRQQAVRAGLKLGGPLCREAGARIVVQRKGCAICHQS